MSNELRPRLVGNLSTAQTTFIGRERLVARAVKLLDDVALLTFTGVGGVGKTRLAHHLAVTVAPQYPDGAWLVDLSQLTDSRLLDQTIAQALRITDNARVDGLTALIDHLGHKRLLLVLDNCEHLATAVGPLVRTLLSRPDLGNLQVITTSRQPLAIPGERIVDVPPLDAGGDPESSTTIPEALQLLIHRALTIERPIQPESMAAARQLCQRLDGIPLAIELAAGRLRTMSPEDILDRLTDRFKLLAAGASYYEQTYHQTLQMAVDWTYDLCSLPQQILWQRLSVFPGAFDLEAAEAVCTGESIAADDVINLIDALVRQSALTPPTHHAGTTRLRLLDTIREYGLLKLRAGGGDEEVLRLKHAEHFRGRAAAGVVEYFGPREPEVLNDLGTNMANLRAAMEYFLGKPDLALAGLEVAVSLSRARLWFFAGMLREGRYWLRRGLQAHPADPSFLQVAALGLAAWIALCQGDSAAARQLVDECYDAASVVEGADGSVPVLLAEGTYAMLADGKAEAITILARARDVAHATGDRGEEFLAGLFSGFAAGYFGTSEEALPWAAMVLAEAEASEARWCISWAQWNHGLADLRHGDQHRAAEMFRSALHHQRAMGDQWGPAWSLEGLAWVSAALGYYHRSAVLFGGAARQQERTVVELPGLAGFREEHTTGVSLVKKSIGDTAFKSSFARGYRMPYQDLVDYALAPQPEDAPSVLTAREFEIARLVADGQGNKQIAATLHLSTRTVENHILSARNKLGLDNRLLLGRWVTEYQLDNTGR